MKHLFYILAGVLLYLGFSSDSLSGFITLIGGLAIILLLNI